VCVDRPRATRLVTFDDVAERSLKAIWAGEWEALEDEGGVSKVLEEGDRWVGVCVVWAMD
jgi:hypothetical protein